MVLLVTPADRASLRRCRRQWDFGARCRRNLEAAERPAGPDLAAALREALAVYYFPGMWDWQRSITLPLVVEAPVVNDVDSCCQPVAEAVHVSVSLAPVPLSPRNT